jgi:hypothetical protein
LQTEILDPFAGMIMISLTPEETILLSPGRYNYNVVMISSLWEFRQDYLKELLQLNKELLDNDTRYLRAYRVISQFI